ncbi:hypothetical protein HYQ45_011360 [Verticillium longisporum]|nr:hypothetical protein HYQ45_011360 [Verticillium longisporum]
MSPPCHVFPVSELPAHVQADVRGRKRKLDGDSSGGGVDLSKCKLRSLAQYHCEIEQPQTPNSPVRCWAVNRFFRECKDKKGTFSVETTAWEGTNGAAVGAAGSATASHQHPGTSVADKTMYSFYQDDKP